MRKRKSLLTGLLIFRCLGVVDNCKKSEGKLALWLARYTVGWNEMGRGEEYEAPCTD